MAGLLLTGTATAPAHAGEIRDKQWHLDAMDADEMWKRSTGSGVTVAVIDTGVEEKPMELKGQVLDGKDFAPHKPGDEHTDYDGHGTGIAGLIAGTGEGPGGDGAFGLAPGSKILPLRIPFDSLGSKFDKPLVEAIRYAADSDAKVINISIGGAGDIKGADEAVEYALSKGKLIFASAGNEGERGSPVEWPAATPGVVGVAALGRDAKRTKESTHGPHVDLSAPGDELVHACAGKTGLCQSHGTSGAAAIASASAALIWAEHPDWTNNQVLRVLVNTAGQIKNGKERTDYVGYGAVRPRVALESPGDPGPADEYPLPDFPKTKDTSPSSKAPEPDGEARVDKKPDASPGEEDLENGNTTLWIATGLGAVLLLAGAGGVVVWSRRRRGGA